MISWTTVQDGISAWVRTASGLTTIWTQQGGPRPAAPVITLRIQSVERNGQDWIDVEDTVGAPAGSEITHKVRGPRRITLSVQCFGDVGVGDSSPLAVLEKVVASARLPSVADALCTAGVAISFISPVQSIDGVINSTDFEPRAVMQVRIFTTSEIEETGTFIESVKVTDDDRGDTFTIS